MKIRTDFVTNSSSSSFYVDIGFKLKKGKVIWYRETGYDESSLGDIYISVSPKQLGTANSIEEMVDMLKKGVTNLSNGECRILDKNDTDVLAYREHEALVMGIDFYPGVFQYGFDFIESLEKLGSMDEIESITITGRQECASEYYDRSVTYYPEKDELSVKVVGDRIKPWDDPGGDLLFDDISWDDYSEDE